LDIGTSPRRELGSGVKHRAGDQRFALGPRVLGGVGVTSRRARSEYAGLREVLYSVTHREGHHRGWRIRANAGENDEAMTLATLRRPTGPSNLHAHPPMTPWSFFSTRRSLLFGLVGLFLALATGALVANSWLLLQWDEPVQRFVESHRTEHLDSFFRLASRMGSTIVVLSVGAVLSALIFFRCRAVAIAVLAATLARPALEFTMKELVGRDRPELSQMVSGDGHSFPSGHPMAAMAIWGMVPVVVGLFTTRRGLWWASVFASGLLILAIAASRVYLGVHWLSDVVAGLLVGAVFLVGVEWILHRAHSVTGCGHPCGEAAHQAS
jgi:undecaprenyl-diphosphatase